MLKSKLKIFTTAVVCGAMLNLTACGTIMHPERKGQVDGRIDPGIAALNAVGLLFWFIPGVIAFAVDFSNGTIYLPGGERAQLSTEEMEQLVDADGSVNQLLLQQWVAAKTGLEEAELSGLSVRALDSTEELAEQFRANQSQLALLEAGKASF